MEAVRAGEHGKSFSVVAEEVRGLASNTTKLEADIEEMLVGIVNGVKEMANSIENADNAVVILNKAFDEIEKSVGEAARDYHEIAVNIMQ